MSTGMISHTALCQAGIKSLQQFSGLYSTMAQMAHFSFPYYFTIPNSEICAANFGIRNCEVYVVWASGNN